MGINEDGYLSEDIERWSAEKRAWYPQHFQLVTEINRTGEVLQRHLSRVPRTVQGMLASAYFVRGLQSYQASILLADRRACPIHGTHRIILQQLNYLATDALASHRTATNRVITIP
jgi:hypothetical protein